MGDLPWTPAVIVLVAGLVGAVTDIWKFRVYNVLTIPLIVTGLIYHCAVDGFSGLATSAAGLALGFGILIVPHLLGLMGAGDVKLLAGVGAWLGAPLTLYVFAVSSIVVGAYALVLIARRGKLHETWLNLKLIGYRFSVLGSQLGKDDLVEAFEGGPDRRLRLIPFGASIPIGIIVTLWWVKYMNVYF